MARLLGSSRDQASLALSSCCRSFAREILPLALRGNSLMNTDLRGRLSGLRRAGQCATNAASVRLLEGTMMAAMSSPSGSLAKPTTATSRTLLFCHRGFDLGRMLIKAATNDGTQGTFFG